MRAGYEEGAGGEGGIGMEGHFGGDGVEYEGGGEEAAYMDTEQGKAGAGDSLRSWGLPSVLFNNCNAC